MSRFEDSIPPAYFDEMYAVDPDPWRFASSDYEARKYRATLEALPKKHYGMALEVGCSIGVLTAQLARCCEGLMSIDIAQTALDKARQRCRDLTHVKFELMRVPEQWPTGWFDLILLSEVVYYLSRADVGRLADHVRETVNADGDIVLVHWLGDTHYPLSGDQAAEAFIKSTAAFARVWHQARTDEYRLDVLRVPAGQPRARP